MFVDVLAVILNGANFRNCLFNENCGDFAPSPLAVDELKAASANAAETEEYDEGQNQKVQSCLDENYSTNKSNWFE
jgi:hypothetical protein